MHRQAIPAMYEKQTYSEHYRNLDRFFYAAFGAEEDHQALAKPYAKQHYRGKPTPKKRKVIKLKSMRRKYMHLIL